MGTRSKIQFTDNVLGRLDYGWYSATSTFVPVIGDQLVETLTAAANTITPALESALPQSLQDDVDAWWDLHGADSVENESSRTIAARV